MRPVPEDVWRHVAQLLPQKDLCGLLEVNSALFNIAMDARYHSVSFRVFSDWKMKQLRRLKDPTVAFRVRHFDVHPFHDPKSLVHQKRVYSATLEDVAQLLAECVSLLCNVTDFSIYWSYSNPSEEQEFLPFITTAWKTFGSGLLKFSFSADWRNLPSLLSTAGILPALQELKMGIQTYSCVSEQINELDPDVALRFIHNVAPTLRSLTLSSYSSLDHSSLFVLVGNIPNLEKLAIRMNFDMCGLLDPRGLSRILHDHALTLCHVDFSSHPHRAVTETIIEWMEANKSDKAILSNLLTFDIKIPLGVLAFEMTMEYVSRSADTLTSLSIFGGSLHQYQVKTMLSIFGHRPPTQRLESLLLDVEILSPELILILARMLPCLHKLSLDAKQLAKCFHEFTQDTQEESLASTLELANFTHALKDCDWQLHDLDVGPREQLGKASKRLFKECIPSIQC